MAAQGSERIGRGKVVAQLCAVLLCLLCAACDSATVMDDRNQREAIEIVALLQGYGINATMRRESGSRGRYYIEVDKSARSQAQTILWEKGYPKKPEATFDELVSSEGLIPSSSQKEALRLDRAMAVELEDMLANVPGVSSARVIVRFNYAKETAGGRDSAPSVSVMLQQKAGTDVAPEALLDLIQSAVPGVARDQVTLKIQPEVESVTLAQDEGAVSEKGRVIRKNLKPFLYFYRVAEDSYRGLTLALVSCVVLVLLAGGLAGYWYGYYQTSRTFFGDEPVEPPLKSLKLDRPKKDLPAV